MPSIRPAFLSAILCLAFSAGVPALETGQPPPSCALKTFQDDAPLDLAQYKGKVVYVDFWASWCGPCSQSMGFLDQMHQQFKPQGFEVVGVNVDENREDALEFLKRYPVKFTQTVDGDGQCPGRFGVQAMPSSYLIDRKGIVRHIQLGYRTSENEAIRGKVQALLAEP